jgi:hypothetical protein
MYKMIISVSMCCLMSLKVLGLTCIYGNQALVIREDNKSVYIESRAQNLPPHLGTIMICAHKLSIDTINQLDILLRNVETVGYLKFMASGTPLDLETLDLLMKMMVPYKSFVIMDLSGSCIEDKHIHCLLKHANDLSFAYLDLSKNNISEKAAQKLAKLDSLLWLSLDNNPIDPKNICQLNKNVMSSAMHRLIPYLFSF